MNLQTPPRLLELAGQSLLREEGLAISVLEELPRELFPLLFVEAFIRRRCEVLKVMVRAWPFPRLPLGSLMKTPDLEILHYVVDGIDCLLAQKVRPRRWKLQVLDLRDVDENFWTIWSGARPLSCSSKAMSKTQTVEDCPRTGEKQPLKVFMDVCFKEKSLDEGLSFLSGWVQHRRGSVYLCCTKVVNYSTCILNFRNILETVYPDSIQVLEIWNMCWSCIIVEFSRYLSQMRNLRKLFVSDGCHYYLPSPDSKEQLVAAFSSVFRRLDYLQTLYIRRICFFKGYLDRLIRCLKSPLETLALTYGSLEEEDLKCLPRYPSLSQLKQLNLSHGVLRFLRLEPLRALLEKVAATLQTLFLVDCGIGNSKLRVILPALSRCSNLTTFCFHGNDTSMDTLKDLLRHTGRLSKLSLETYPAPRESLDNRGRVVWGLLTPLQAELMRILREVRQPNRIFFGPISCPCCGTSPTEQLELSFCFRRSPA
ncbi:PRAME family member 18 [Macaca thibetana thibetana]|uniref:PRAME family member 18 n=1 Tax=Macaca thibetana thibetana TaxID=257877 RepID=UPI0021BC9370|nr:PRAME family member 18 [Macaca thibetana thibetana]